MKFPHSFYFSSNSKYRSSVCRRSSSGLNSRFSSSHTGSNICWMNLGPTVRRFATEDTFTGTSEIPVHVGVYPEIHHTVAVCKQHGKETVHASCKVLEESYDEKKTLKRSRYTFPPKSSIAKHLSKLN